MDYHVFLSPEAEKTLHKLPRDVALQVTQQLEVLGRDLFGLSRKATSPYPARGQTYEFDVDTGVGRSYHIIIMFFFNQNETDLDVHSIGYI